MKMTRERKGQFIVIAALLLSIMIISVGTVIYGAVTYFRHQRWEEYLTVIDSIKTGSYRLMEISLARYSQTSPVNQTILRDNLNQWIGAIRKAHAGFDVHLSFKLETGISSAYGMNPNYNMGLNYTWNEQVSYSAANATFSMDIASVGLTGYNFSSFAYMKMNITDAIWYSSTSQVGVRVIIQAEGPTPVTNLQRENFLLFKVNGVDKTSTFALNRYYASGSPALNAYVYDLRYGGVGSNPGSVSVEIWVKDTRGIQVKGLVDNLNVIGV